jgi:hypothetical protein
MIEHVHKEWGASLSVRRLVGLNTLFILRWVIEMRVHPHIDRYRTDKKDRRYFVAIWFGPETRGQPLQD